MVPKVATSGEDLEMELPGSNSPDALDAIIGEIDQSPLFDHDFYQQQTRVERSRHDHIRHYLTEGERAGLLPSTEFEPAFYALAYSDVAEAGGNLLVHYVEYGQAEARYPTRGKLRRDAAAVRASRVMPEQDRSVALAPSGVADLTNLEWHLVANWREGTRVTAAFDDISYFRLYPDVALSGLPPLVHYVRIGRAEGRFTPSFHQEDYNALRNVFDSAYYRSQRPELGRESDALLDYLIEGRWAGVAASPVFQQEYYLRRYPDIQGAKIDPYRHFVEYGAAEHRIGRAQFANRMEDGDQAYDPDRETVLVASHEASRTGAPLVALAVGEYLSRTCNVIYAVGRSGVIEEDFKRSAVAIVKGTVLGVDAAALLNELKRDYNLSAAVFNSVETYELAEGALEADIPSVGLIHEFAEYSAGRIGRMVSAVDRGILPAQLLLDSAQLEMTRDFAARANNLMVHPQGYLPTLPAMETADDLTAEEILAVLGVDDGPRPRIVLGAGFVHIRKGIDLFIQAAAEVRKLTSEPIRFVWVGDGFDPQRDHHYSLWIDDMIKRLDLQDVMFFFDPQGSLDTFFELADVFMLSSRLDPFPNVVLDAFEAGRPVVCFDRATGVAEWLKDGRAVGAAVDFCDTHSAAREIVGLFRAGHEVGSANADLARREFDFDKYGELIVEQLALAKTLRSRQLAVYDRLASSAAFDANFHEGKVTWGESTRLALKRYVSRGMKGLSRTNPRPGFSDNLYKSRTGLDLEGEEVALDHAIRQTADLRPTTHRCLILDQAADTAEPFTGRIAVHLHLYYPELTHEFVNRLNGFQREIDLFVTTAPGKQRAMVDYVLSSFYRRGRFEVFDAPNRGRDIGPFMTLIGDAVLAGGYDVIGHFHGKKSRVVEHLVPGLGDRWRTFLADTLMGSRRELDRVLGQFAADPALGLVFAEDRNAVGWAKNLPIAQELAARLAPSPELPASPFYPLGNMFWARPAAVRPLWDLGLTWSDYPPEPLPYDGTILHAVERMLPAICEATGHSWMTVHKPGNAW